MTAMKRGTGQGALGMDGSHRFQFGWLRGALLLVCAGATASEFALPRDGWVSWTVTAVEGAPEWCCHSLEGPAGAAVACDLDSRRGNYTSDGERSSETLKVYALMRDGQATRVRAYGPSCPVRAGTPITQLGALDTDASARWLAGQMPAGDERFSETLGALALHAGSVAEDALARIATDPGAGARRKDAVFWLGHARGEAGVRRIEPLLTGDPDAEVREHAAFAVSQSGVARRGDLLLRQAKDDEAESVRSQAWFWLAQTGDARTEDEVRAALHREASESVRHQAIFALSQLPGGRGVPALIAVIEDRGLPMEDRKQALFWLGQSESDAALAYLDRVLR